jgi:hypothetical protein
MLPGDGDLRMKIGGSLWRLGRQSMRLTVAIGWLAGRFTPAYRCGRWVSENRKER